MKIFEFNRNDNSLNEVSFEQATQEDRESIDSMFSTANVLPHNPIEGIYFNSLNGGWIIANNKNEAQQMLDLKYEVDQNALES